MAFEAFWYEYESSITTGGDRTGTIGRSSGRVPAKNWSIREVPNKIGTTELSTTSQVMQAWRSLRRTISLMVPLISIGWYKAKFRHKLTAGRTYFLHEERKKDWSTKLGAALVSIFEMTGCTHDWCLQTLRQTYIWNFGIKLWRLHRLLVSRTSHASRRVWGSIAGNIDGRPGWDGNYFW